MVTLQKPTSFDYEMHHGAKTQIIQSRDTYKKFQTRNQIYGERFFLGLIWLFFTRFLIIEF